MSFDDADLNNALRDNLSDTYDPEISYARGDYCNYNGTIYYCKTATTGDFDISKWASVNVMAQLRNRSLIFNAVYEATAADEYNNLASNLPFNTFSYISPTWFTDMNEIPQGVGHIIYVAQTSNVGRTQIFVQSSSLSGCIYIRYASPDKDFKPWSKFGPIDNTLSKSNTSADSKTVGDDLANTYDNSASYNRGDYCLYDGVVYRCTESTTGSFDSSKWSATNVMKEFRNKGLIWNTVVEATAASEYNNLAYNLPFDTFSFVSPSWFTDMYHQDGITTSGIIFYVAQSSNIGRTQIFIQTDGKIFTRYANAYSEAFNSWVNVNDWYVNHTYDTTSHYYAYGDSTTKGQIGTWTGESSGTSVYNYPAMTGKRLNLITHNMGVGGQGLCKDYDTIINNINNTVFEENTRLVTVGWAYNDSYPSFTLGNITDTSDDTVIGKYYNVMKLLQQKNQNALVVLVTGFGFGGGNLSQHIIATLTTQFTHNYTFADGTKTVKEFYTMLEDMCNLHGWPCINQAKGCAFNEFNASSVFGDNIHPTNNGYKIYSNFITAKLESFMANNKY